MVYAILAHMGAKHYMPSFSGKICLLGSTQLDQEESRIEEYSSLGMNKFIIRGS